MGSTTWKETFVIAQQTTRALGMTAPHGSHWRPQAYGKSALCKFTTEKSRRRPIVRAALDALRRSRFGWVTVLVGMVHQAPNCVQRLQHQPMTSHL